MPQETTRSRRQKTETQQSIRRKLAVGGKLSSRRDNQKALRNKKKNMCLIFLLIIMQRMVTSSTAAVKQSLEKRLSALLTQNTRLGSLSESDLENLNIEEGVEEAIESFSLNMEEEVDELQQIIAVAKQAEFQCLDVKVERLTDALDALLSDDQNQKIIIFTEFVATQMYLRNLLVNRGYSVTILNGSMSVEDRDVALREFRDKANIFVSTDAGGEGLNLQFANIIINYDLPWNPMKIEQRVGRADRIGQTRDVHVYNFIVADTVENRVREVLEEKLSVILQEMGVDKYSDVLDGEVAEMDFTDVYMHSIGKPYKVEENLYPVESEMKQQLQNTKAYKTILHEEKDLSVLVGQTTDFDIESSLRMMLAYYESWQGQELKLIDKLSIMDPEITQHLKTDILQDRSVDLMSVGIRNFPNEAGYFMLWELSVSNDENDKRILPIFINENFVLRPMAGKRLMDVFLNANSQLTVRSVPNISSETYEKLRNMAAEFAYESFSELKEKKLQANLESYNKYMYALQLRMEATRQIGIENIRRSRLRKLEKEKEELEAAYTAGIKILPDFRLTLLARLEA